MNRSTPAATKQPATSTAPTDETGSPGFAGLGVPARLVSSLSARGIDQPFPIQTATLPDSLRGRDVLGRGRTGSGKTLAFSLPTVAGLAASGRTREPSRPRALVLVPTRELARQVDETMAPLAAAMGLRTTTVFGGVSQGPQVAALRRGIDVCVATPGRLEDLISQRHVSLDAVEITVLDEADHMADLGFLPPVRRLMDQTPKAGQRMLFSATLDGGVDVLVQRYLTSPVTHSVDSAESEVPDMTHHLLTVAATDKPDVVAELVSGTGRTLAFTRTKHAAKKLARKLTAAGIPAVDLHGNLSQAARLRNLDAFHQGSVRVMVATDIAARGIHIDDVSLVVHVDPPMEHKAYLHRSGRTARAGASGTVVTVGTDVQRRDIDVLMRRAKIKPIAASVGPGHPRIIELTGPAAPRVTPQPDVAAPMVDESARRGRSGSGNRTNEGNRSGARGRGGNRGRRGTGRPAATRTGGSQRSRRSGSGHSRPTSAGQQR